MAQLIYPVLALSLLVASCAAPETPVKIIGPMEVLVKGDTGPQELPNMRFLPSHPNFDPYIRIDSNLAAFGGKSQSEIAVILGNPNLVRRDSLAHVWLYTLPACRLHIFFYGDTEIGEQRVAHFEISVREGFSVTKAECLQGMIGADLLAYDK